MSRRKALTTAGIIVFTIAAVAVFKTLTQDVFSHLPAEDARAKGNPDASVRVVEYIDFQCPMCAAGAKKLKAYMTEYPDKIYLELRYFPLEMHKHAFVASQYVECAGRQGKLWDLHDVILDKQRSWSETVNAPAVFDIYAAEIGLDMDRLKSCLPSKTVDEAIEKSKKEGRDLGVRSTPTYFVNGEMVVGIKLLQDKMDGLLKIPASPDTAAQE